MLSLRNPHIEDENEFITVGHYSELIGNCNCNEIIRERLRPLVIENKCKIIYDILDCYQHFDNVHVEAHMRLAFFGVMSYPIAKYIYTYLSNYPMRLIIDIFDEKLKNCSLMLKNNIEEKLKIGVYNFDLTNTHARHSMYNVVILSDMLFEHRDKINVVNEISKIISIGCFVIITDVMKKDNIDTCDLENGLGIPPLDTIETFRDMLNNSNLKIINVIDYINDLKKHLESINNTLLLENIDKLEYNLIVLKTI